MAAHSRGRHPLLLLLLLLLPAAEGLKQQQPPKLLLPQRATAEPPRKHQQQQQQQLQQQQTAAFLARAGEGVAAERHLLPLTAAATARPQRATAAAAAATAAAAAATAAAATAAAAADWPCSCGVSGCPFTVGLRLASPAKANLFLRVFPSSSSSSNSSSSNRGSNSRTGGGYHELLSVFQALSLCDEVAVHLRPPNFCLKDSSTSNSSTSNSSSSSYPFVSESSSGDLLFSSADLKCPPEKNLIFKALKFFRRHCMQQQQQVQFVVHLRKAIPMLAGLGGGSSNAATVLHAADLLLTGGFFSTQQQQQQQQQKNQQHQQQAAKPQQEEGRGDGRAHRLAPQQPAAAARGLPFSHPETACLLAAEVGADVPFFLASGGAAVCSGRGEKVICCSHRMPLLLQRACMQQQQQQRLPQVFVVKGDGGCSSKAVFEKFDELNSSSSNSNSNGTKDSSKDWTADAETVTRWLDTQSSFPHTRQTAAAKSIRAATQPSPPAAAVAEEPSKKVTSAFCRCLLRNDLFAAAAALQPRVAAAAGALRSVTAAAAAAEPAAAAAGKPLPQQERRQQQQALLHASGLTGSGAALVGLGPPAAAAAVRAAAAAQQLRVYTCEPIFKRPLASRVYVHPVAAAAKEAPAMTQQRQIEHLWLGGPPCQGALIGGAPERGVKGRPHRRARFKVGFIGGPPSRGPHRAVSGVWGASKGGPRAGVYWPAVSVHVNSSDTGPPAEEPGEEGEAQEDARPRGHSKQQLTPQPVLLLLLLLLLLLVLGGESRAARKHSRLPLLLQLLLTHAAGPCCKAPSREPQGQGPPGGAPRAADSRPHKGAKGMQRAGTRGTKQEGRSTSLAIPKSSAAAAVAAAAGGAVAAAAAAAASTAAAAAAGSGGMTFSSAKPSNMEDTQKRLINFSAAVAATAAAATAAAASAAAAAAGPCQLPVEVLEQLQRELVNYKGWGLSVMEMSHRGSHYKQVLSEVEETTRSFLEIPSSHALCFMAGGATAQFAAEALNLLSPDNPHADYAVTGHWSRLALNEGSKFGETRVVTDSERFDYKEIEPPEKWTVNPQAAYLHYCDNETIHGLEFPSSGTQKNVGIAGATLVVMNRAILDREGLPRCPSVLSYKQMVSAGSCLNTPPAFNIYVAGVTLQHLRRAGDLAFWDRQCSSKSDAVYRHCDSSGGFFEAPVKPEFRSRVSVRFNIAAHYTAAKRELEDSQKKEEGEADHTGEQQQTDNDVQRLILEEARQKDQRLTKLFLEKAEANGIICVNGHRSLGGLRACTYAGISEQQIEKLLHVMQEFEEEEALA
ncbi:hypothetical protein Efla_004073 [Eimeria flavescens]